MDIIIIIIVKSGKDSSRDEVTEMTVLFVLDFLKKTSVSFHWDFSHGKFASLSPRKASCDAVALSNLQCMLGVLVFSESTEL